MELIFTAGPLQSLTNTKTGNKKQHLHTVDAFFFCFYFQAGKWLIWEIQKCFQFNPTTKEQISSAVLRISQTPFIWSTPHLADVLPRAQGRSAELAFWQIIRLWYESGFVWMIVFASQFPFSLKQQLQSWLRDICHIWWGQKNMFSYICAALQIFYFY